METSANRLCDSLKSGRVDPSPLRQAGAPDPEEAASALLDAAGDPDLAESIQIWAPALLCSARPGFAAHSLLELARRRRALGPSRLDIASCAVLPRILGSSNFLTRILLRRPEWIEVVSDKPARQASSSAIEPSWRAIREAKYRGLLEITGRDLAGRAFADSLAELSALADRCLVAALACASGEMQIEPPVLFALGKLGGRELNFSSDVDLLFIHRVPDGKDPLEHNHALQRMIRHLKRRLEEPTEDGFGYRVDLDLRPEGRAGVLANSVDAALTYYETWGAEWERQMLIRLRRVAGPEDVAQSFSRSITPFVYRRLIDPSVMQSVRDMKSRIEDERRHAGRDLEADLKEGPGGIRDVEFLVQSFQLFYGGHHPELRTGNVLESLAVLTRQELLPDSVTAALRDGYLWLRGAEHALQRVEEQQTYRFPRGAPEQLALARRMGYDSADGGDARARLLDDWTRVRGEVRTHFEALIFRGET